MQQHEALSKVLLENAEARKELASKDLEFFAIYYLEHYVPLDTVGDFHNELIDILMDENDVAIAAPRGHGKSTWVSLIYPLWCILFKYKNFILLLSDSQTQASLFLGAIIEELETNERIINDFGKIAGYIPPTAESKKKWTASDIVTLTDVKVLARGWNGRFRGIKHKEKRPDLVIFDDVENDENVRSELQRDKIKNVFKKSVLNLGAESIRIMIVGTILHYDSLLMNVINGGVPGFDTRMFRAIKEDGTPLWPEGRTIEWLEDKKRQIGSIAFEQEFMNNPLDESSQIIKPQSFYTEVDISKLDCYGYIDLAISEKQTADYTAIVTAGVDRSIGKIYILDPIRFRGDVHEQLRRVFEQHNKFKYKVFGVESVAYQKAFYQWLSDETRKTGNYVPVKEIEVDKDKVRRVLNISAYVENGTVLFNAGHEDFLAELKHFPKGAHDDYVDAFSGAVRLAIDSIGTSNLEVPEDDDGMITAGIDTMKF